MILLPIIIHRPADQFSIRINKESSRLGICRCIRIKDPGTSVYCFCAAHYIGNSAVSTGTGHTGRGTDGNHQISLPNTIRISQRKLFYALILPVLQLCGIYAYKSHICHRILLFYSTRKNGSA